MKNAQFTRWGVCKQRTRVNQVKHVRGQVQTSPRGADGCLATTPKSGRSQKCRMKWKSSSRPFEDTLSYYPDAFLLVVIFCTWLLQKVIDCTFLIHYIFDIFHAATLFCDLLDSFEQDYFYTFLLFQMDKFIELIQTRAWTYSPDILSAMFRVFCSLVISCHDSDTLLSSATAFLDAFFGDPGFVAGNVLTNYITLQLLIDKGTYLEDNNVFLHLQHAGETASTRGSTNIGPVSWFRRLLAEIPYRK